MEHVWSLPRWTTHPFKICARSLGLVLFTAPKVSTAFKKSCGRKYIDLGKIILKKHGRHKPLVYLKKLSEAKEEIYLDR